jgi:hypothetical protein
VRFGRRQIEPATVDVRFAVGQAVRPRTDDAPVDHSFEQVAPAGRDRGVADLTFLVTGEQRDLVRAQVLFDAVQEPDAVRMVEVPRCLHDDAHRPARVQHASTVAEHVGEGDDLRAGGVFEFRMFVGSGHDRLSPEERAGTDVCGPRPEGTA